LAAKVPPSGKTSAQDPDGRLDASGAAAEIDNQLPVARSRNLNAVGSSSRVATLVLEWEPLLVLVEIVGVEQEDVRGISCKIHFEDVAFGEIEFFVQVIHRPSPFASLRSFPLPSL